MSTRLLWEDLYFGGILENGDYGTLTQIQNLLDAGTVPALAGDKVHGIIGKWTTAAGANKFNLMPMDAYPTFKENFITVQKNYATGKSTDNVQSYVPVHGKPEAVTIPVAFNANNLTMFLRLFFQNGALTPIAGTVNNNLEISKFIPYTSATPIRFGMFIRLRQTQAGNNAVDQALLGIVVKKITIKGEEGGIIEGEIEAFPVGLLTGDYSEMAGVDGAAKFDETLPLKFEDSLFFLGKKQISVPSFELTFENNIDSKFFNWPNAQNLNLGRLKITGTIPVPWNTPNDQGLNKQILDFKNGVDKTLSVVWGADVKTNVGNRDDMTDGWIDTSAISTGAPIAAEIKGVGVDTDSTKAKNSLTNNYVSINLNIKFDDYDETDIDDNPMSDMKFAAVEDTAATFNICTIYTAYNKTINTWIKP